MGNFGASRAIEALLLYRISSVSLPLSQVDKLELFFRGQPMGSSAIKISGGSDGRHRLLDTSSSNNILIKFKDTTPAALQVLGK